MGRWAFFQGISPLLLDRLVSEPRLVLSVLALHRVSVDDRRAELEARLSAMPTTHRDEYLQQFDRLASLRNLDCFADDRNREASGLAALRREGFSAADLTAAMDIEKRWRWLHELLDAAPEGEPRLGYTVVGGVEVGEDLGYGPVRYLRADEVCVAAAGLASLSEEAVRARLGPWTHPLDFDVTWGTVAQVRGFYTATAGKGFGALLHFG